MRCSGCLAGIPGSGKSTFAQQLMEEAKKERGIEPHWFEADHWMKKDGVYHFDSRFLGACHDRCRVHTAQNLKSGGLVIVSNTFTRDWELQTYTRLAQQAADIEGQPITVMVCMPPGYSHYRIEEYRARQVHGVPEDTMQAMASRWDDSIFSPSIEEAESLHDDGSAGYARKLFKLYPLGWRV